MTQVYYPIYTAPFLAIPALLALYYKCYLMTILGKVIVIGSIGNHWFDHVFLRTVDIFACHVISPGLIAYFSRTHWYTLVSIGTFLISGLIYYVFNSNKNDPAIHSLTHVAYVIGGVLTVLAAVENETCC